MPDKNENASQTPSRLRRTPFTLPADVQSPPPYEPPPCPSLEPPSHFVDPTFWRSANRYQFIYSVGGLILGFTSMIGGMVLFLHGVAGSTSWTAKILGASSQITDAGPGAILFIVGLFMVYVTRYGVKVK